MFTQSYDVNWIEIDERQSFPQFSSLLPVCRVLEFLYTIHSQTCEHTHSHTHISSGVTLGWRLYTEAEILLCRGLLKCHLSNSSSHVYAEGGRYASSESRNARSGFGPGPAWLLPPRKCRTRHAPLAVELLAKDFGRLENWFVCTPAKLSAKERCTVRGGETLGPVWKTFRQVICKLIFGTVFFFSNFR